MALGERIKECRQQANLSQEKVAELVGVSRQAVTKWEANQSAPSTENLFKLAEIFGTSVDLLLTSGEVKEKSIAEQVIELYKAEEQKKKDEKRRMWVRRLGQTMLIFLGYLLFYMILRVMFVPLKNMSVKYWLITTSPYDVQDYLYGWIINSNLFAFLVLITLIFSLCGKFKTAWVIYLGNVLGYILGCLFGPNPEGAAIGQGHYGWAIWIGTVLISVIVGCVVEKICKKRSY